MRQGYDGQDAVTGAADTQSQIYGVVAGLDYYVAPNTMFSFAVGGGTSWQLNQALRAGLTAGLGYRLAKGWPIIGKFDGEYSSTTSIYAGTGMIRKV